jgi:hypothetical protein
MHDNAFGDLPCLIAKIMTHTHNKGHCVGPHPSPQGMTKNQLCNEHKKPHQYRKRKEALKLKVESQEEWKKKTQH